MARMCFDPPPCAGRTRTGTDRLHMIKQTCGKSDAGLRTSSRSCRHTAGSTMPSIMYYVFLRPPPTHSPLAGPAATPPGQPCLRGRQRRRRASPGAGARRGRWPAVRAAGQRKQGGRGWATGCPRVERKTPQPGHARPQPPYIRPKAPAGPHTDSHMPPIMLSSCPTEGHAPLPSGQGPFPTTPNSMQPRTPLAIQRRAPHPPAPSHSTRPSLLTCLPYHRPNTSTHPTPHPPKQTHLAPALVGCARRWQRLLPEHPPQLCLHVAQHVQRAGVLPLLHLPGVNHQAVCSAGGGEAAGRGDWGARATDGGVGGRVDGFRGNALPTPSPPLPPWSTMRLSAKKYKQGVRERVTKCRSADGEMYCRCCTSQAPTIRLSAAHKG